MIDHLRLMGNLLSNLSISKQYRLLNWNLLHCSENYILFTMSNFDKGHFQ
jgi:hypothetical protein